MDESSKQIIDAMSVGTMLGTISAILPPISAMFTIVWVGIRIWETDTVQGWFQKKRKRDDKGRFVKED
jgi:hypothetical protein